jgi:hypothetical protein
MPCGSFCSPARLVFKTSKGPEFSKAEQSFPALQKITRAATRRQYLPLNDGTALPAQREFFFVGPQ